MFGLALAQGSKAKPIPILSLFVRPLLDGCSWIGGGASGSWIGGGSGYINYYTQKISRSPMKISLTVGAERSSSIVYFDNQTVEAAGTRSGSGYSGGKK